MLIGIDYDKTITLDFSFWDEFFQLVEKHNHQIICITGRQDTPNNRMKMKVPESIPILFAFECPKKVYAEAFGYFVDVWVENDPKKIVDFERFYS